MQPRNWARCCVAFSTSLLHAKYDVQNSIPTCIIHVFWYMLLPTKYCMHCIVGEIWYKRFWCTVSTTFVYHRLYQYRTAGGAQICYHSDPGTRCYNTSMTGTSQIDFWCIRLAVVWRWRDDVMTSASVSEIDRPNTPLRAWFHPPRPLGAWFRSLPRSPPPFPRWKEVRPQIAFFEAL